MAKAHSTISHTLLEDFDAKRMAVHKSLIKLELLLNETQRHLKAFDDAFDHLMKEMKSTRV